MDASPSKRQRAAGGPVAVGGLGADGGSQPSRWRACAAFSLSAMMLSRRKLLPVMMLLLTLHLHSPEKRTREAVRTRTRMHHQEFVALMTSTEFARYYRISKPRFEQVVRDITPPPRELRKKRAAATRGVHGKTFIEYDLRLSIALRYLAGGSYLDLMYLHGVGKSSVFHLLWDTLERVDAALPEFTLEDDIHDLERCKELSAAFARPTATSWAPSRRGTASRSRWSAPATRTRPTRTSSGAARASRRSPSRPHATQTAASATSRWSLRVACTTRGPTAWPARAAAASSAARWRTAGRCR